MSSGNELFSTSSLSYTNLIGWIMVIIISIILLMRRRKKESDIYIKK